MVIVTGVWPVMAQEVYKSGSVETPLLNSSYQLLTFKMTTDKGEIGAPIVLRFKDANGRVLFETNLGRREKGLIKIDMKVKLHDVTNENVTVFPELVIGDSVITPEHPMHVPAGMLERMAKLKSSGATFSGSPKSSFCSQPLCGCEAPDGCYVSYYECACGSDSYQICRYTCSLGQK